MVVRDQGLTDMIDIFVLEKFPGTVNVLHGDVFEKVENGGQTKPTISLSHVTIQQLVDELDKMGYKPQKGFLEGKLEATEKHLEDMRELVFKKPRMMGATDFEDAAKKIRGL